MDVIEWLNTNEGMVMSVLTLVYVIATVLILVANYRSVAEMKIGRKEEYRPYVIVYFETQTKGPVNLIVKNIGKTIAKNTEIKITPELNYPTSTPLSKSNLLNRPIPDIPPDFQYKAFVETSWNLKQDDDNYPIYKANVTYENSSGDSYKEEYVLDLNFESGLLFLDEKDIHDLTKDFNEYTKENQKELQSLNSSLKEISNTLQSKEKR